jgi:hypothetical protein
MNDSVFKRSKLITACTLWAAFVLAGPLMLAKEPRQRISAFESSGRAQLTQEQFSAAKPDQRARWVSSMTADLDLGGPQNVKSFEILTWGLRDKDATVRKAAATGSRYYLENLRQKARGTNAGKLPIKREVIAEFERALKPLFEEPDKIVRSDAIRAHIWLRGSANECAEAALKVVGEFSIDVTEEWGRRHFILGLMQSTGYPVDKLPPDYLHPNSRKPGEPLKEIKMEPPKKRPANDNTWFDMLSNSLP